MPYHIDWKDRGVYWTYTGIVTGTDLLQSNFDIYGDERFDQLTYQIVNLLEAESFEVTERQIQKMAHLDAAAAKTNTRIRVAVVARSRQAIQIQQWYAKNIPDGGWPTQLFETLEAAEEWVK